MMANARTADLGNMALRFIARTATTARIVGLVPHDLSLIHI